MKHYFGLLLLFCTIQAHALTVIADLGGEPITPYFDDLNIQATKPDIVQPEPEIPQDPLSDSDFLPVKSSELKVGHVDKRQVNLPGLQPLFLIGYDNLSIKWLQNKLPTLQKLNAIGLVVNITHRDELNALRKLAKQVQLYPVSADDLAKRLELTHYPVLITTDSIEQ